MMERIERELDACVRPILGQHGGDLKVISFEKGLLKLRMLGPCTNCPSAVHENERLFEGELKRRIPEIEQVLIVTGVSDDLINAAKALLRKR
jgi:Fe-S cluster biogenesis protein NfuA